MKKVAKAKGTRDFLPAEMRQRRYVIDIIRSVFENYGYEPLETPAFERWDVLKGKLGDEGEQLLFKIMRRGTKVEELRLGNLDEVSFQSFEQVIDLALRYDLTVPLCRMLAMNPQIPKPFKRYQIQPVWRADRPRKGRYREFFQCDIDIVGCASMLADAEIMAIVYDCMNRLGFNNDGHDFQIKLNHRKILNALVETAGGAEHFQQICVAVDKMDKIGFEGVRKEFAQRAIPEDIGELILERMSLKGETEEILNQLEEWFGDHEEGKIGLQETRELYQHLKALQLETQKIPLDLFLVRGLDYYTGPIFEVIVDGTSIGSLGGGGRYDNLIGRFSGTDLPATGATIGLERIIDVMIDQKMMEEQNPTTKVLVTVFEEALLPQALQFTQQLRQAGISTEIYLHASHKMKKQFKYAGSRKIPIIAMLGPDEIKAQQVTLRAGRQQQQVVAQNDAPAIIQQMLSEL